MPKKGVVKKKMKALFNNVQKIGKNKSGAHLTQKFTYTFKNDEGVLAFGWDVGVKGVALQGRGSHGFGLPGCEHRDYGSNPARLQQGPVEYR